MANYSVLYTPDTPDRTYYINMIPGGVPTIIHASQYEDLRTLYFHFVNHDGSIRELVQTSNSGEMTCVRPDGKKITIPMSVMADDNQMAFVNPVPAYGLTDVAGDILAEFELAYEYGWTPELRGPRTANFIIRVEPSPETLYEQSGGSVSGGGGSGGGGNNGGGSGSGGSGDSGDYDLQDYSWENIKRMADAGVLTSLLSTPGILISERVTLSSGEELIYKAAKVTDNYAYFEPILCLSEKRQLSNSADLTGEWGYYYSTLATFLNGDFFDSLPTDIRSYISPRTVTSAKYNRSSSDKVWLPLLVEIRGNITDVLETGKTLWPIHEKVTDDDLYNNESRIRRNGGDGERTKYWTASSRASGSRNYNSVIEEDGSYNSTAFYNANNQYGILPCFMIGDDGGE